MGAGSGDKAEGNKDEMKGKLKEGAGGVLGDEEMSEEGKNQQVKGQGKQTWGDVKDTGQSVKDRAKDALD